VAFPESVVQLLRGELGQPYGGFPAGLQRKVLKGALPLTGRAGAALPAVDLAAERARIQQQLPRPVTDEDLASYLMYPKVWLEYARERALYGDPAILPTPVFFYGMEPGQEISVDLERGKTLIVRYLASSEPHEDGTRTVFFELNGQPRSVRVPDNSQVARRAPPRKVEAGDPSHVGAPMPGVVASVAVKAGAQVLRGDLLLTLEGMKMETAVRAAAAGEVSEVLARPGQSVEARDLLVIVKPAAA
jgi:pyruvate carboxylase